METLNEKASVILQNREIVVLTSVNQEGYPRPVPMSKNQSRRHFGSLGGDREKFSENQRFLFKSQSGIMLLRKRKQRSPDRRN